MFYNDPIKTFEVEGFDLDPLRILQYKKSDTSISGQGKFLLLKAWVYLFMQGVIRDHDLALVR